MMHLILADSELELVPKSIRGHAAVRSNKSLLLDASLHYSAMKGIKGWRRRGRPDIVHIFLLVANESILNKEGKLRVYIHTRNNETIYVKPGARIIKNYNRFKGLMEQLLMHGRVPLEGEPLLKVKKESLKELLSKMEGRKILFSEKGYKKKLDEMIEENMVCIIGGFPHGDFISPVYEIVDDVVKIYDKTISSWTVEMEAIISYERKFLLI